MFRRSTLLLLLVVTLLGYNTHFSQGTNLPGFDDKPFHFGFALSVNQSSNYISRSTSWEFSNDSLNELIVNAKPGFTLGVISSINLNENCKLRFAIPSLSFQERILSYTYLDPSGGESIKYLKSLQPVYLDFPALIKFRTDRINNYAVYGITGLRFGIDMASDIEAENIGLPREEQIVKLKKTDFGFEVGGGFDFFLQYFKLGLELKLGVGMVDIHQNEETHFDNPIEALRSKVWTFSITFEG
tara:strand:- start:72 stop:800 length:729 start_codon:yes stop_codon:yes gene_type:complete